jgi:HK97 family phage major capsid protein
MLEYWRSSFPHFGEISMSGIREINDAIDKIGGAFVEFKNASDAKVAELLERIEEMEAKAGNPRSNGGGARIDNEHKAAFDAWVRSPLDERRKAALIDVQMKAMSVGSNADGGFAVPKEIFGQIEKLERKISPMRNLVKVLKASTSDFNHLLSMNNAASGWSSESGTRSATAAPTLRNAKPTHGELYAYPQASNWALEDIFFDVQSWLVESVAEGFSKQEGAAVISGNGTDKPTGLLNTTPVATTDDASPVRAQAAYQFISSDLDSEFASPVTPTGVTSDSLIDAVYTLNSQYRNGASWIMNSLTAGAIRKKKDAEGRYIWQDGLTLGQPPLLLGYPVNFIEDMPDIASNAFPVGFGNWQRAYLLVDIGAPMITVDPYTTAGQTKFYVRRRVGGFPLNNNAAKFIRTVT